MDNQLLYKMALHQRIYDDDFDGSMSIIRVPGGWIYIIEVLRNGKVLIIDKFVPYDREFNEVEA